jgi:glucosylglycerate synthase
MATADPISDLTRPPARTGYALLVMIAALPEDQFANLLATLTSLFPPEELLVAAQNSFTPEAYPSLRIVAAPATNSEWTLTAADFLAAHELAQKYEARHILVLGPEAGSLTPEALRELTGALMEGSVDLALPLYQLSPNAGLVNSAILYPLTRALFATRARFPLAIDLGLSPRMAERLAAASQRLGQNDALVWPVSEAVAAGFNIGEYEVGERALPQPADPDIRTILVQITGSLFSDVETKAAFWQRARRLPPVRVVLSSAAAAERSSDVASMVEGFRLAYSNLQEIWGLVLPPATLVGLKRLSVMDAASFRMPENLWARIVYDFLVAYRLRTINRGHLLGALIPLYLAWVAGHINLAASGGDPERHIEAVATAFDADKPYLVSRWRWPDRFNP